MTHRPRRLSLEQRTIQNIKRQIPYGYDKRARYVEHVCGLLLDSRSGPGSSEDMFTLEEHHAEAPPPSWIDQQFRVPASAGHYARGGQLKLELQTLGRAGLAACSWSAASYGGSVPPAVAGGAFNAQQIQFWDASTSHQLTVRKAGLPPLLDSS